MKLSEAMRLGAKIRPQAHGMFDGTKKLTWFDRLLRRKPVVTSCAWRAALEAQGCGTRKEIISESAVLLRDNYGEIPPRGSAVFVPDVPAEWDAVTSQFGPCPQCDQPDFVIRLITHLNDDHAWTREAIAIWIAGIESKLPTAKPFDVLDAAEIG